MASSETAVNLINNQNDTVRQLADFPENIWADRIASFNFDKQAYEMYEKEIEMLKEEVVNKLLAAKATNIMEKLDLIDKIERLGISYHFEDEIKAKLEELFNTLTNFKEYPECDLSTTALKFRLLRQHGFNTSAAVFEQFVDANGKFKESLSSDIRGLLNLYEAAHVRTRRDEILDEALAFKTTHLARGVSKVDSTLAKQVKHALEQPLHKCIPRYVAYCFISIYEEDESNNKLLLRLAKLSYNLLQMSNKQDLCELIRWGNKMDLVSEFPYARYRIVECYFWAAAIFHEPQYSHGRLILAKVTAFVSLIDDTYDAYGSLEELKIFTDAIERWDGSGLDQLPEYMKAVYNKLLNFNKELEEILAQRTYVFDNYIEEWKKYTRTSFNQSKWFIKNELPSFADYLSNGLITSAYSLLLAAAFLGMDSVSEGVINFMATDPKLTVAPAIHARLSNDVASYKFEKERGSATAIECYMKDYNVSEEEAVKKFEEMCDDAWKDMNEDCLRLSSVPREILKVILNLARACEVVYKNRGDGYTNPQKIEGHIKAMFIDPVPV